MFGKFTSAGTAAALVALINIGSASAAEEIKMTAISGHPPAIAVVKYLKDYFIPEVDRRLAKTGKYKIKWTQAYAGTVAKVPAVFEAIQQGIADMGHVFMGVESAKMPMESITYVTPFGTSDLVKQLEVVQKLHDQIPEMNAAYEKYNQVLIALAGVDSYHIFSKTPVRSLEDIRGKKLGIPGAAANWLNGSGAAAVRGNLTTYYNALKTGVYDGVVVFGSGSLPFKFYEVAPNLISTNVGAMFSAVLTVNKDKWNSLPKEVQEVFRAVGREYTKIVAADRVKAGKTTFAVVKKNGGKVTELPDSERTRWANSLPPLGRQWAAALDKKGLPGTKILNTYMDLSRKAGVKFARDWDQY